MSTPWSDYLESVAALASMPGRERGRQERAAQDEAAAVGDARSELASRLAECREWEQAAARALATAEARLVSAQILLPDPAAGPPLPQGSPAELADAVAAAERDLDADLAGLAAARRAAARQAADDAARAARIARRKMLVLKYGGLALVVLAVVLAVALS
jgi:hypothetical protein